MSPRIRPISAVELPLVMPALIELLQDAVNGGASLGFLAPLAPEEAREYWQSLRPELEAGARVLLAAYCDDRLVGSGQLLFPKWSAQRHRAEVQKLFVLGACRGHGIGRSLMAGLHGTARQQGRSLILLNTRRGEPAEGFYTALGYREAGVIPGFTIDAGGKRHDTVTLYQDLALPKIPLLGVLQDDIGSGPL